MPMDENVELLPTMMFVFINKSAGLEVNTSIVASERLCQLVI